MQVVSRQFLVLHSGVWIFFIQGIWICEEYSLICVRGGKQARPHRYPVCLIAIYYCISRP